MKVCPMCGAIMEDVYTYCSECSGKLIAHESHHKKRGGFRGRFQLIMMRLSSNELRAP